MATRLWYADFETGNVSQFSDGTDAQWTIDSLGVDHTTANPFGTSPESASPPAYAGPGSTTVQTTIKRAGTYAAKIILKRGDCRERSNLNTEQRHMIHQPIPGGGGGNNLTGVEMWTAHSFYIASSTSSQQNWYGIQELHQRGNPIGGGTVNTGSAPFNLSGSNEKFTLVLRGSTDGAPFKQTVFGVTDRADSSTNGWGATFNPATQVLNTVPFTYDVWHDWIFGFYLHDVTGWFQAYHKLSTDSTYTPIVQKTVLPTWYNNYSGAFYANVYRQGYPSLTAPNTITIYHDAIEIWNGPPDQLGTGTSAPGLVTSPTAPTGTPQVASLLTATTGTWTGTPTSYTYHWYRCNADGSNAVISPTDSSAQTYAPAVGDIGYTLRCYVTAVNTYGSSIPAASDASGVVTAAPSDSFALVQSKSATGTSISPSATLTSTPTSGNLIVALIGWNSTSVSTAFTAGAGTSGLTSALNGESGTMRYRIYYKIAGGSEATTYAGTLDNSKPWCMHVLEYSGISSTSTLDKTADNSGTSATASTGTTATTTDALQLWLGFLVSRSTTAQSAPTNSFTQTLTATTSSDCVTGVYTKEVTSTGTASVAATVANSQWHGGIVTFKKAVSLIPVNTVAPVITGNLIQGQTLTCSDGTWTNSPTITYQWQRDAAGNLSFSNIASATAATRVLAALDVGCNIRCVITATNASGAPTATSDYRGIIAPLAPLTQTPPTVTGTATVGQQLSTTNGEWLYVPTSYTYQWQRDLTGSLPYSNISGATSSTYTLVSADSSCHVLCNVTATNSTGSGSAVSNALLVGATAGMSRTQTARTVNPSGRISGRSKSGTGGGL